MGELDDLLVEWMEDPEFARAFRAAEARARAERLTESGESAKCSPSGYRSDVTECGEAQVDV